MRRRCQTPCWQNRCVCVCCRGLFNQWCLLNSSFVRCKNATHSKKKLTKSPEKSKNKSKNKRKRLNKKDKIETKRNSTFYYKKTETTSECGEVREPEEGDKPPHIWSFPRHKGNGSKGICLQRPLQVAIHSHYSLKRQAHATMAKHKTHITCKGMQSTHTIGTQRRTTHTTHTHVTVISSEPCWQPAPPRIQWR